MKPYWQHFTKKYVFTVIFISIFFLITSILLGISFESKSRLVLVSVDEIRIKEKPYKGEQTEIYIIGNKFAIWKFYSHEIDIDENKKEIKIKLWVLIEQTPPGYMQFASPPAILPYNYSINIIFTFSGIWEIECNNKNISVIVYS